MFYVSFPQARYANIMSESYLLSEAKWAKKAGTQTTNNNDDNDNPNKVTSEKSRISCIGHNVRLLSVQTIFVRFICFSIL